MIEPRNDQLKALLAYWRQKKGERRAPTRADIDPAEIKRLLPYVGLVDVERSPLRFRYRLVGSSITLGYGAELTGRYLDEADINGHERDIVAEYARVVETGDPVCATWEYTRNDGRHLRYERLALPLMTGGANVDMLFGGAVFEAAYG